jgi:YjbR protein
MATIETSPGRPKSPYHRGHPVTISENHPVTISENRQAARGTPIMADILGRLRTVALTFPDAAEKISHGHPAFYTTKVFAYYGGSVKVDGVYQRHEQSLLVLIDPGEREALLSEDRCYVPAYLGPSGWIGVDLTADTDWAEVDELLDASYRRTAGPRRVAMLDRR